MIKTVVTRFNASVLARNKADRHRYIKLSVDTFSTVLQQWM